MIRPLTAVNGIILNINKELIPAVANLNPNTMPIWPKNPIVHIITKAISVDPVIAGIDVRFGTKTRTANMT